MEAEEFFPPRCVAKYQKTIKNIKILSHACGLMISLYFLFFFFLFKQLSESWWDWKEQHFILRERETLRFLCDFTHSMWPRLVAATLLNALTRRNVVLCLDSEGVEYQVHCFNFSHLRFNLKIYFGRGQRESLL